MAIIPVDEIPTVSLLYHLKKLVPATRTLDPEDEAPTASQSFNDRICVIRADITKLEVDAIVNAANNSLLGGGGVDGAIHRAAGPELLRATRKLNGCDTGSAKITEAFYLPCKKIIHAVGPVYYFSFRERCAKELASCYSTSLKLAVENGCKSIAFSAISTGVYGYPSTAAAHVAIQAVKRFLQGEDGDKLEKVIFVTFMPKDIDAYNKWLPRFFPSTEPEIVEPEQAEIGHESIEIGAAKLETESDWEEVEAGESAENGSLAKRAKAEEEAEEMVLDTPDAGISVNLPNVPTSEPTEEGRAIKKVKPSEL